MNSRFLMLLPAALLCLPLASCGGAAPSDIYSSKAPAPALEVLSAQTLTSPTSYKRPPAGRLGWDLQLGASTESKVTLPNTVRLIEVDGFGTSAQTVADLKAKGAYVVCYINAGSYESYRPDSGLYPNSLKLQTDPDWPDESFLDIRDVFRSGGVLADILKNRIDMCKAKGFDAVDPDNLQNDENITSGVITRQDQLNFNGWLTDTAHRAGLAIFQKNGPDRILQRDKLGRLMVDLFDGIVNEQCGQYKECAALAAYVERGKPALNVEYRAKFLNCAESAGLGINSMLKDLNLVGMQQKAYKRTACQ